MTGKHNLLLPFLALLATSVLSAAEHHGLVRFGGLPVPGATITATQGEKKFAAITDQQGAYSFRDLADGLWTIRVEMLCFEPIEREVAVTAAAPSPQWDLKLAPLEKIIAAAPAPAPAPPPATAAAPAPPAGKKGKTPPPPAANTATPFQRTDVNASAEGAKSNGEENGSSAVGEFNQAPADGFLINGSVNNGAASPFAQSAAFGNFRRGPRSLYNGSIGATLDDSFFNARSYSLTGQDTPKPAYSRITGLASFGGPLKIPRLLRNNGPNFTLNYQWMRNRNASLHTALVPTADERNGIFPSSIRLIDPTTGAPLYGNVIPQSRISPQALSLLRFYPLPNFDAGANYNYQVPITGGTHQDSLQARINKTVKSKNTLTGSFGMQSTRSDNTSLFGFLDTNRSLGMNTSVNWMRRFGLRMFLNLGAQFSRMSSTATPFFAGRENVSAEAGISGNNQEPVNWGPPALSFASGLAGLSDTQASGMHYQTSGISGSLFKAQGSHNITVGGDFRRQQFNLLSQQDPRGTFTFTGAAAGNDFAGFLLGIPDTSSIAFGNADKYLRAAAYDAYINDDWRFSPSLTINAGLRWEYGSPITERYGRLVNLDIARGFTAVSPVVSASPSGALTGAQYPDSLINPDKRGIAPRIALSWRPFLASSMVVRAGYGIYYDSSIYTPIAVRMAQQAPLSKTLSVGNSAANPLTLANGFNIPPGVVPNTFAVDPNFRVGYSQNWQVSVQRDLPGSMVMIATYLGTKGTRAQQQFLPNTYPVGAVNPCPACPAGFAFLTANGNSTRESGQIQLRRRLHSGFTAQLQYTLAKALDDAALGGRGQGAAVIAQDWLNLSGERGRSPFDQRHLVSFQMQYTTGMGLAGGTLIGGWKGSLLKDWTIATQISAGTGLPLTPIYMAAVRGTGVTGSIRPDYTGASIYAAPPGLFLNPAAVAPPAPGQWGNAGRNSITGPGQFSLNASLGRTFRFTDRVNAEFRLDAQNALNHPTFPSWNTTITSAQFGLPMTANTMRTVQSTLRVRF